jgi:predicted DNA-binding ribbon-helix-helix protein
MEPDSNSGGDRVRRNVNISGRRTSVSLEAAVWDALADICKRERVSQVELFSRVDNGRLDASLASALRVFVLTYFRGLAIGKFSVAQTDSGRDGQEASVLACALAEFTGARRAHVKLASRVRR